MSRDATSPPLLRHHVAAILVAATALAVVLRGLVAYNGGIWADEGSFLNVISAPSWRVMIDFLKEHESHPPLFYLMMRAWAHVVSGDTAMMVLPLLIGTAIVPAIFLAGRVLFDERVALVSAAFAAVAAPLVEHSSQLRPYGMLMLLALTSTAAMALGLSSSRRRAWVVYAGATSLMLYTHNWGWLVFGAQQLCAMRLLIRRSSGIHASSLRDWLLFSALVVLAYLPWLPSLLYQATHAGHGSLPIEGHAERVIYVFFAVFRISETILIGRLSPREQVSLVALGATIVALVVTTFAYRSNIGSSGDASKDASAINRQLERSRFLRDVALIALLAALAVSPFNNLLLPRGIATIVALLLLLLAFRSGEILARRTTLARAHLTVILITFGLVCSIFEVSMLVARPRSNMREIAGAINASKQPTDLLVVAPEWFAASFDHYFPPSIEQIDYPFTGRSGLISFSNVWETRRNASTIGGLQLRLSRAREEGRRVWFVSEKKYLKPYRTDEMEKAFRNRLPAAYTITEMRTIRSTLERLYGPPQVILQSQERPVHDDIFGFLFLPDPSG